MSGLSATAPRLLLTSSLVWAALSSSPAAAQQPWAEVCGDALRSRAPLVQAGALLALRDRAIDHAAEVLDAYCREKDPLLRRRMALVLGEAGMRQAFHERSLRRHPDIPVHIKALGSAAFAEREAASAALRKVLLDAEPSLRLAAASSQLEVARRARLLLEPLDRHDVDCLPAATDPESELWRWSTAVAILHRLEGELPRFWTALDEQERNQIWQMFLLSGWRELRGADDPKAPNQPWPGVLRSLLCENWQLPGYQGYLDELTPPFAPLAPLVRVSVFRAELGSGKNHVFGRCLLSELGDAAALDDLDLTGVDDPEGLEALRAASAKARVGRTDGLDALWELARKHPKPNVQYSAEEQLHHVLDLGVAPFPTSQAETLRPWLTDKERAALEAWRMKHHMREGGLDRADFATLSKLQASARQAFMHKLREVYERERKDLVWSPIARQFHPRSKAPAPTKAPPVHPGLAHCGSEDAAARAWYAACAQNVFHAELTVSVGAVRGLLWGEAAAAQAVLSEARKRLRDGQAEKAACLIGLGRLLPTWQATLAAAPPAAQTALARAAADHPEATGLPEALLRYLHRTGTFPLSADVQRQARPVHLPLLLIYQEQNPLVWEYITPLDRSAACPFLLRELERERTGSERYTAKRGEYPTGYFMYLFRAFAHYQMREATPTLIRYASGGGSWPAAALTPLGEIGGDDAVTFLKFQLKDTERGPLDEYLPFVEIALARNGDRARLDRCVELLWSGPWAAPRRAAEALKACLPFAGPDFAREPTDRPADAVRQRVHAAWRDWFRDNGDRLEWDPATRRYVLR